MNLTLKWDGPVGPKNFPEAILEKESLSVSGVYLRLKQYENGHIVSYVGHSVNLLSRFDQHLRDILTFSVTLRDDFGEVLLSRNGSDRAAVYNRLDTLMPCIEKELSRTQFLFARCGDEFGEDYLKVAEALLKQRMECRIGFEITALENLQNISIGGLDHELFMQSDTSLLEADCIEVLNKILGDHPIGYCPAHMES